MSGILYGVILAYFAMTIFFVRLMYLAAKDHPYRQNNMTPNLLKGLFWPYWVLWWLVFYAMVMFKVYKK